jgi:RimJ/RimL family protein N-acetyltransferase
MILETARLILREFQDEDIGRLAELMANPDFMRFSLGPYTREQTQTVLQKFLSWNQAGCLRSLRLSFARIRISLVIAVFSITRKCQKGSKSVTDWIPHIGTVV